MTIDGLTKNPGTDMDIGTRIKEIFFGDAKTREPRQPGTVDLHKANIDGLGIGEVRTVNGIGAQARLGARDGVKKGRIKTLSASGVSEAKGIGLHACESSKENEGDEQEVMAHFGQAMR
jgi:hypothetical protein